MDYGGGVGVEDILQGAFFVTRSGQLDERVARRYGAILGHAPLWAPAATGKTSIERRVERAAIHAGLSAGHDTLQGQSRDVMPIGTDASNNHSNGVFIRGLATNKVH
jgi:hypothetical protein